MKFRAMTLQTIVAVGAFTGLATAGETSVPPTISVGSTAGIAIGASPPPGLYFALINSFIESEAYNDQTKLPIKKNVFVTTTQLQWVTDYKILGGTYKAMATLPWAYQDVTSYGLRRETYGNGDLTLTPVSLSWMLQPGIFVSGGLSFTLPTGSFSTKSNHVNSGSNAFATTTSAGFSYLRNGWNLSADFNYVFHTTNSDTNYRSGDEFVSNWTAMKDFGSFSFGPIGYWRKQVQDDVNNGTFYRGVASGRAQQVGLGVGFSKQFGKVTAGLNFSHDIFRENTLSGGSISLSLRAPISF
ncbi:transporter [Rhizobium sp.]|jgi:hypothetical protein|uniref:SphA family protein n=1 Tax=Rhizobium sp. TaxID=391 RepID=UPI000E8E24A2|nr:hypothetical protein [Rhizobium sp.]